MKKTTLPFLKKTTLRLLSFFVFLFLAGSVSAQNCQLGCNGSIQVSLNSTSCSATITPQMMLNDTSTCMGNTFSVELRLNGVPLGTNVVDASHIGLTLEAKVMALPSTNACWGNIVVEDKVKPVIEDDAPDDIFCYEQGTFSPTITEACGLDEVTFNETEVFNNCANPADSNVIKTVTRTYVARDLAGNVSMPRTFTYNVLRLPSLNIINFPANRVFPNNSLSCSGNYKRTADGNPHPDVTGYPLLPNGDRLTDDCNLTESYRDTRLPAINCVTKIMRTWTITEWSCTQRQLPPYVQMIEIADTTDPEIVVDRTLKATTSAHECEGLVNMPAATVSDDCGNVTVSISVRDLGIFRNSNGGNITLPVGENYVVYTAADECGNIALDSTLVTVADHTPPVAVCDQNTSVGLSNDGKAWVKAEVFDDGSYDECGVERILVRRMDNDCDCPTPVFTGFEYLGNFHDRYFYLSEKPKTAALAAKHALAMGGNLATIPNALQNGTLTNAVANIDDEISVLIGYNDVQTDGNFRWQSQVAANYSNWASGQPGPPNGEADWTVLNADNGTWELAGDEKYNYIIEVSNPCGWGSYVAFCCNDEPRDDVMVAFRVIDNSCNYNECMVNVDVQNKLPNKLTCPDDMIRVCTSNIDLSEAGLIAEFGEGTVASNCDNVDINYGFNDTRNQCGVTPVNSPFTRTLTIPSGVGSGTLSCTQRIEFTQVDNGPVRFSFPRDPNPIDGCFDPEDERFSPDNLGYPSVSNDACALVGYDFEDKVFTFNSNTEGEACFKIIRTWTAIDWCNQDSQGNYYTDSDEQVIVVVKTDGPEITAGCDDEVFTTFSCDDAFVELTATATDECTLPLRWTYQIDAFNDGTFEPGLGGTDEGSSADASGTYPVGTHRILWTVGDRCGNVTTCEKLFTIESEKAPTPYCLNGLAVSLMQIIENGDTMGMVDIWASDFDRGSEHPCYDEVYLSFSPDTSDKNVTYTCDDLGRNDVTLYVTVETPNGKLIQSFCNTFIDVQNNGEACPDARVSLQGRIATESDATLKDVEVRLEGKELAISKSDDNGNYGFAPMSLGGQYMINPVNNADPMLGVSTKDLILMQRHILKMNELDSPYKRIAADINMDRKITAADLVELRKLILGVTDGFRNNESWRFIDKAYEFVDLDNTLNELFTEDYSIPVLNSPMNVDFVAVKTGDVDNSVETNLLGLETESRSADAVTVLFEGQNVAKGQTVDVEFDLNETMNLAGAQFTITFDPSAIELIDVKEGDLAVTEDNFGFESVSNGKLSFSWNSINEVSVSNMFTLTVETTKDVNTSELFTITSDVTSAEAYDANLETYEVTTARNVIELEGFSVDQNIPNPFNENTVITFNLPKDENVVFTVFDVTGKVLLNRNANYTKGSHTITLSKSELGVTGILYYQIEAGEFAQTKKMVILD